MTNKPSRREDIAQLVQPIVANFKVPLSLIESLRGRLLYASGHTFGKCTQLAIQLIATAARSGLFMVIDDQTKLVDSCSSGDALKPRPRVSTAWPGTRPTM